MVSGRPEVHRAQQLCSAGRRVSWPGRVSRWEPVALVLLLSAFLGIVCVPPLACLSMAECV